MSLDSIMTQIATVESGIVGVLKANDKAPATMNVFPSFVNFPAGGTIDRRPSTRWPTHKIILELHVTKQVLPEAERLLRPYLESTLDAFDGHLTLNGTCGNSRITSYQYGVLTYNGQQHLGITFTLEATEITPFTFVA
jgi:hypothetical protein